MYVLTSNFQVLVYSQLSGRWVRVREFGPDNNNNGSNARGNDSGGADSTDALGKNLAGRRAAAESKENGGKPAFQSQPPRTLSLEEERTSDAAAASRSQEQGEAGDAEEKRDRRDGFKDWAEGTPVSARFMRLKVKTTASACLGCAVSK